MTKIYFEELMREFACHINGLFAFGTSAGMPFCAQLLKDKGKSGISLFFACQEPVKNLAAALNQEKMPNTRWFGGKDDVLEAIYYPPSDFYAKSGIFCVLQQVANLQKQGKISPPECCPICGAGQCNAFAYYNGAYRKVHKNCVETGLSLPTKSKLAQKPAIGAIVRGLLGAFLGAALAALPIWALALSQGKIHWALYAFIPFLSGLCYRLCRGKASFALAGFSVLGFSLLAAFALEQVWYWLVLCHTHNFTVPFGLSISEYFRTHNIFLSLREMFSCLLALLAGYMGISVFLRRYIKDDDTGEIVLYGAQFTKDSMCPIN